MGSGGGRWGRDEGARDRQQTECKNGTIRQTDRQSWEGWETEIDRGEEPSSFSPTTSSPYTMICTVCVHTVCVHRLQ